MLISDWSSDVCSSDLCGHAQKHGLVDLPVNQTLLAQHEMVGRKVLGQKADNLIVRHFGLGQPLCGDVGQRDVHTYQRSEEHTSELQSLMRISYAVFCLKKKKKIIKTSHLTSTEYTRTDI